MKKQTKDGFKMTGAPEPTVTSGARCRTRRCTARPASRSSCPRKGKNVAGGKELLRVMLSKEAATNFAKTKLAPTIVKGTVPADGFGSTALVSQTKLLDAAGTNIFSWNFVDYYGMNQTSSSSGTASWTASPTSPTLTKGCSRSPTRWRTTARSRRSR